MKRKKLPRLLGSFLHWHIWLWLQGDLFAGIIGLGCCRCGDRASSGQAQATAALGKETSAGDEEAGSEDEEPEDRVGGSGGHRGIIAI